VWSSLRRIRSGDGVAYLAKGIGNTLHTVRLMSPGLLGDDEHAACEAGIDCVNGFLAALESELYLGVVADRDAQISSEILDRERLGAVGPFPRHDIGRGSEGRGYGQGNT
jgi:hypothetical protein